MSVIITLIAIIFTFLNFKWYTQDRFWITYYGTPHEMVVVALDSFKSYRRYEYSHTLKFVDTVNFSDDHIDFVSIDYRINVGKRIDVNVLDNKAAVTEKPSIPYSIFWGVLMLGSWYLFYNTVLYKFFSND
ncbi:hypothetical protein [uncultured Aquimarina sp.]|uniref:hypothetical protein n=1 Tax=uncultured Aquimarina sp. TaxID=575652 RepID=UPI00261F94EF|nr:hypothetical protein [uncultured Aquimarina sp.]